MTKSPEEILFERVLEMEGDLRQAGWLLDAVQALGVAKDPIPPATVFALGCAVAEKVKGTTDRWEEVFRLSAALKRAEMAQRSVTRSVTQGR